MPLNGTESGKETPSESIEYIHHLHMSGDTEGLAEALSEEGHSLVKAGHIELLGILRVLEASLFGPRTRFVIHELTGISCLSRADGTKQRSNMIMPCPLLLSINLRLPWLEFTHHEQIWQ